MTVRCAVVQRAAAVVLDAEEVADPVAVVRHQAELQSIKSMAVVI